MATAATVSATSEEEDNGSDEVPAQSGVTLHHVISLARANLYIHACKMYMSHYYSTNGPTTPTT